MPTIFPLDPGGEAVDPIAGHQRPPGLRVARRVELGLVKGLVAARELSHSEAVGGPERKDVDHAPFVAQRRAAANQGAISS